MRNKKVLVIGAGYAGLAATLELQKLDIPVILVEKTDKVGGLSQTIELDGVKFELGPHIYFDKDKDVKVFWSDLVGDQMKSYLRNNRIFYNGKYIKSPLSVINALQKLGPFKVTKMVGSFALAKAQKHELNSAKDWVVANFGQELFDSFFKVYNEKIWGIDCTEIAPNWAGQRIKSSLSTMVVKSIKKDEDFIIKTFDFPDGGSQTLYKEQIKRIQENPDSEVKFECYPTRIKEVEDGFEVDLSTGEKSIFFSDIISTIHLDNLVELLESSKLEKAKLKKEVDNLMFRHLVLVNLVFEKEDIKTFKEHWVDVHDPNVKTLRVTNFGNYEFNMGNDSKVGVGLEYNCFEEDAIWKQSNEEILKIALQDLKKMGLTQVEPLNYLVVRLPKAYPVYYKGYEENVDYIFKELKKVKGLYLTGRNSLYKWNNMHHSVKTGILAARNINGENNNLLDVKGMVSIGKESD